MMEDLRISSGHCRLREQLKDILASPEFVRSPVMSRLLTYLVDQAIADPDNPPKAYHIAVEGLGRSEDFDVQADSYPRVLVGRLRKMLTAHYAVHDSPEQIFVPMGGYAVKFQNKAVDDDDRKVAGLNDDLIGFAVNSDGKSDSRNMPASKQSLMEVTRRSAIVCIMLLGIVLLYFAIRGVFAETNSGEFFAKAPEFSAPPILYISGVRTEAMENSSGYVRSLEKHLQQSFQPFHTVRLSSEKPNADSIILSDGNAYRLNNDLVRENGAVRLESQLVVLDRKEIIWSKNISLSEDIGEMKSALNPIVSQIASTYGVIPDDQRASFADHKKVGHLCALSFDEYRRIRDPKMLKAVKECVDESLKIDPLDPELLSAASFLGFISIGSDPDPEKVKMPVELAGRALLRGRNDAVANFAVARAAFFVGDCDRGKRYSQKARALNPLDHDFLVKTGAYLFACNEPQAESYIRRAIELDHDGSVEQHTALALLKVSQGKAKEALAIAEKIVPPVGRYQPYYQIAMVMIYAENNQLDKARAGWREIEQNSQIEGERTPENILSTYVTSKQLVKRGLSILRNKKIVEG